MSNQDSWTALTLGAGQRAPAGTLRALETGELPAVVLRGPVTPETAEQWAETVRRHRDRARTHAYVNGALTTIGPYMMKMLDRPEEYFSRADEAGELFAAHPAGDPLAALRDAVATALGLDDLSPASDPAGRDFAPGVVRLHDPGVRNPLHSDLMSRDVADHPRFGTVGEMALQLSLVLCLESCRAGDLLLYRRPWQPEHEVHKVPAGLGYAAAAVGGAEVWRYHPETGDIYVFHGRLFHEITEVERNTRITLGCFMGWPDTAENRAVVWA